MKSKVLQLLKLKVSDLKEFQGDFKTLNKKWVLKKTEIRKNKTITNLKKTRIKSIRKFVKVYSFEFVE